MQIDLDFDVYKALTALRESEADTFSDVLRRVLDLPPRMIALRDVGAVQVRFGVWFGDIHFPEGTKFRATYKGRTFSAEISGNRWRDDGGNARKSPSDAARAICGTSVNGWRFWHVQMPGQDGWRRLDELKS